VFETGVPAFLGYLSPQALLLPPFAGNTRTVLPLDYSGWAALEERLGAKWGLGYLGFSVRGFFENGGRRCYIFRLGNGPLTHEHLTALDAVEDFDLVCVPGQALGESGMLQPLVEFFEERLRCFLILHAPQGVVTKEGDLPDPNIPQALRGVNVALYTPWVKVRGGCLDCGGTGRKAQGAPCLKCSGTGQGFVPPDGHVAGVYARTDQRSGVHKAPANEVLEGVLDLRVHFRDDRLAELNYNQAINCLRALPGRGLRIWGARTLAATVRQDFTFVNTRRTFLSIARWLELALAEFVFEPNELGLWVRICRDLGAFLEGLYRRGALVGATAAEAFYVKCDAETNPPSVREAGQVITEVGLALARPNEFIVVRLISTPSGTSVTNGPGGP
jgi:hypothetical protein